MDPLFDVFSLEGLDRLVVCTIVGVLPVCPSFAHANHNWFRIWRSQGTSGGHQAFNQSVHVFGLQLLPGSYSRFYGLLFLLFITFTFT